MSASPRDASRFQDLRGAAGRVVFGAMAAQMAMGAIYARGPLTPIMLEDLGWARGDLALAASPQTWMTALASPVAGYLTQRYGARPLLAFGAIWVSVVFLGFSQMQTLWQLFGLSIAVGILVASVGDVPVGTVVSRWVVKGRGLALGIVYSGSNLSGFISSTLAGVLVVALGWRATYAWIGIGASLVLLPTVLLTVREPPRGFVPSSAAGPSDEGAPHAHGEGMSLREAIRTPSFWLLWISLLFFYMYFIGVNGHLTLYLTDLGMSPLRVALNYGVMVGIGVAAKLGIGLVADRWPAKVSLLVCFAFVILAAGILLAIGDFPQLALPFVAIHGIATMAQNVVYPLIVAWCFGTRHMASIYGVIMLALFPGGTIGPIALGYLHDALGSYDLGFQTLFLITIGCFVMLSFVRPLRVTAPEPA